MPAKVSIGCLVVIAAPKAAQKLLRRAKKNLKSAGALARKAAKRHKGAISADCAAAVAGALRGTF